MSNREAPTAADVTATVSAALDQAEAELARLRAHLADVPAGEAGVAYCAARSAAIVAGVTGQVADQLRDLAGRESLTQSLRMVS